VVLQTNRYFSRNVRGKAALVLREMAGQVYGRMVDDCRDKSTTLESLKAGEVLGPTGTSASYFETT
jgi:hypothetical protein